MVALDIKLVVYHYGPLGARCNAKPAPLAKVFVDPDKTFLQGSIPYFTRQKSHDRARLALLSSEFVVIS